MSQFPSVTVLPWLQLEAAGMPNTIIWHRGMDIHPAKHAEESGNCVFPTQDTQQPVVTRVPRQLCGPGLLSQHIKCVLRWQGQVPINVLGLYFGMR